jgi:hypothetical protein
MPTDFVWERRPFESTEVNSISSSNSKGQQLQQAEWMADNSSSGLRPGQGGLQQQQQQQQQVLEHGVKHQQDAGRLRVVNAVDWCGLC